MKISKENLLILIASILFGTVGIIKLFTWANNNENTSALFFGIGFLMVPVVNYIRWRKNNV